MMNLSHETVFYSFRAYAQAIHDQHLEFDVIFGPAYKGIPLVTAFAIAWYELFGESKDICYNRKEAKDHGEVSECLI